MEKNPISRNFNFQKQYYHTSLVTINSNTHRKFFQGRVHNIIVDTVLRGRRPQFPWNRACVSCSIMLFNIIITIPMKTSYQSVYVRSILLCTCVVVKQHERDSDKQYIISINIVFTYHYNWSYTNSRSISGQRGSSGPEYFEIKNQTSFYKYYTRICCFRLRLLFWADENHSGQTKQLNF